MTRKPDLDYHNLRAQRELDLGLTAQSTPVARAHLTLASMHLQKARELASWRQPSPLAKAS